MPETRFTLLWPDGGEETCYSPSTAIRRHLTAGASYALPDFLARARTGLHEASARVEARFGHPCSLAMNQLARIEARAALQPQAGRVACLAFS